MALETNTSETVLGSQEQFEALLHEQLRQAVRIALISVLDAEVEAFIGALPPTGCATRFQQASGEVKGDPQKRTEHVVSY